MHICTKYLLNVSPTKRSSLEAQAAAARRRKGRPELLPQPLCLPATLGSASSWLLVIALDRVAPKVAQHMSCQPWNLTIRKIHFSAFTAEKARAQRTYVRGTYDNKRNTQVLSPKSTHVLSARTACARITAPVMSTSRTAGINGRWYQRMAGTVGGPGGRRKVNFCFARTQGKVISLLLF